MEKKKIVVLGDLMLDRYSYGTVNRLNPEDKTTPLVNRDPSKEAYKLGGAGNVAANIASLLGEVLLIGALGKDANGTTLMQHAKTQGIDMFSVNTDTPTIVKHRIIADNKYLIRVDDEERINLSSLQQQKIAHTLQMHKPDFLVVSDYAKGTITSDLMEKIRGLNLDLKLLVDTKPANIEMFQGAYLIKPNFTEFCEMIGKVIPNKDEIVAEEGKTLAQKYGSHIMVTRSEKGATLITKEGNIIHRPTHAQGIVNVTGAGDTFLAAVVVKLAEGKSLEEAMDYGNKASGVVVGKMGTAVITPEEL